MKELDGRTRLVGVMGWPIEHTLSPPMQNAAIGALGLNWLYVALAVAPERLAEAVAGARAMGFVGLNVTIPHKQAVLDLVDDVDRAARAIGAANTIHFQPDGRTVAANTDADGFTRTVCDEGGFRFAERAVLLVGTGGAGRAMAAGAAASGAARVFLFDTDPARAQSLKADLERNYGETTIEVLGDGGDLARAAAEADLIANATPLGMRPDDPLPIAAEAVEARHTVFDAVYRPAETPLLAAARRCGARVVPGLGMLARQGARSLAIWSGRAPDEDLMIETLRKKIAEDGRR